MGNESTLRAGAGSSLAKGKRIPRLGRGAPDRSNCCGRMKPVTYQFFDEGGGTPNSESRSSTPPSSPRVVLNLTQDSAASLAVRNALGHVPSYKIINATTGPSSFQTVVQQQHYPTSEMAEDFYETHVTFVQADKASFKDVVQRLTGYLGGSDGDKMQLGRTSGSETANLKHDRKPSLNCLSARGTAIGKPQYSNCSAHSKLQGGSGCQAKIPPPKLQDPRNVVLQHLVATYASKQYTSQSSPGIRSPTSSGSSALSPVSPFSVSDLFETKKCMPHETSSVQRAPCHQLQQTSDKCEAVRDRTPYLLNLFPEHPSNEK